jgi:hypothetical protein
MDRGLWRKKVGFSFSAEGFLDCHRELRAALCQQ